MILKALVFCVPLYLNNNSILFESLCKITSIVSNGSNKLSQIEKSSAIVQLFCHLVSLTSGKFIACQNSTFASKHSVVNQK